MKSNKTRRLFFLLDDDGILYRMSQQAKGGDDPIVKFRLKVIAHHGKFGYQSTCHAFSVSKTSLYRWRRKYVESGSKPLVLRRKSTKPRRFRRMENSPLIVEEISRLRQAHYRLGKSKLKPLVDEFCIANGLDIISESTIGKLIKRHNLFYQRSTRMYHKPSRKRFNQAKRGKRLRAKKAWKPTSLGHLQLDTIVKFQDGLRWYAISVMDSKTKFTLTQVYTRLSSKNALTTLKHFQLVYPVTIKSVQTDNGLEFLGDFDNYLKRRKIKHYFSYPRCPKINAYIERYNRSFQEEFWDNYLYLMHKPKQFHQKLLEYLLFFNTKRVHQGINNQTPMDYLINKGYFSQKCATHT